MVKIKYLIALAVLLSPICFSQAEDDEVLHVVSDEWCPYACAAGSRPGYFVEVLQESLKDFPIKVDYEVVNWVRAVRDARLGTYDVLVGTSQSDAPDFSFVNTMKINISFEVFTLANRKWNFTGEFKGHKIGAINGYSYDERTNTLIASKDPSIYLVSGDRGLDSLIPMLNSNRIDGVIESAGVFNEALHKKNMNSSDYVSLGKTSTSSIPHSIAISPKYAKTAQLLKWIQIGYGKIEKNGTLAQIKKKYGL